MFCSYCAARKTERGGILTDAEMSPPRPLRAIMEDSSMTNRTAFVTGASRGIGRACAQALSDAGARVILAARDAKKLEEVAMQIPRATCVAIDLASPESIKEAFSKAGKIDILVNNAGITKDGLAMRMKKEDW